MMLIPAPPAQGTSQRELIKTQRHRPRWRWILADAKDDDGIELRALGGWRSVSQDYLIKRD